MSTSADLDLLAVAAHPDDAELGCGGILAAAASDGLRVGILDLTRGELGSRGTVAIRQREAAAAGVILGLTERVNAGLPDGGLQPFDPEQRLAVIRILRRLRPRTVLVPWSVVRHPDHAHASHLAEEACFRAGLHKLATDQEPFRPGRILYYMERIAFEPSVIVDTSRAQERKLAAILAHRSQFVRDDQQEPETFLTRPEFMEGVEARDRHFGDLAGCRYGEPLLSRGPLAIANPSTLLG